MTRFILLLLFWFSANFCFAQSEMDLRHMSRQQVRQLLLSQPTSDLSAEYARKHEATRQQGNGFLFATAISTISASMFAYHVKYEKIAVDELTYVLAMTGFVYVTAITFTTAGILHIVSARHLRKAREFYLSPQALGNSVTPALGLTIRF